MKKSLLLLLCLFCLPMVLAEAENDAVCAYLQELQMVNFTIPSGLPYTNEVANLYTMDNAVIGHVKLENKVIVEFDCSVVESPTYNVNIKDKATLETLVAAQNPVDTLNQLISDDKIAIHGTSVGRSTKTFFARMGLWIVSLFS